MNSSKKNKNISDKDDIKNVDELSNLIMNDVYNHQSNIIASEF